ncbi:MAG: hypothetical protein AB2L11_05675 [Syntrophobacteraceae bacterium]
MKSKALSDYNRDQLITIKAIQQACEKLSRVEIEELKKLLEGYLRFRNELEEYHVRYLKCICRASCFETGLSSCCSFESIITFFADHVINYLFSTSEEIAAVIEVLVNSQDSGKCVYLGGNGCVLKVRPVTCAMFLCGRAKQEISDSNPGAEACYEELLDQEKEYTWPTKPVLFNDLETYFMRLGVESPHLYFHRSPGLIRLKEEYELDHGMPCSLTE